MNDFEMIMASEKVDLSKVKSNSYMKGTGDQMTTEIEYWQTSGEKPILLSRPYPLTDDIFSLFVKRNNIPEDNIKELRSQKYVHEMQEVFWQKRGLKLTLPRFDIDNITSL